MAAKMTDFSKVLCIRKALLVCILLISHMIYNDAWLFVPLHISKCDESLTFVDEKVTNIM